MTNDLALLVIDMQQGLFDEGPYQPEAVLKQVKTLVDQARANHVPVIYVQHNEDPENGSLVAGSPGHAIHLAIAPQSDEVVIQKFHANAFEDTTLDATLKERGIRRLIICGMQTDYCINATSRGAHALGYEVVLAADAHTTGNAETTKQLIADYNEALHEVATVKPTEEITFA